MSEIYAIPASVPKPTESAPTAPVRETGGEPTSVPAADSDQPTDRPAVAAPTRVSGLTTFRDEASGLTVVQIFHAATGQVIAQFPSDGQLERYPSAASDAAGPSLAIDT